MDTTKGLTHTQDRGPHLVQGTDDPALREGQPLQAVRLREAGSGQAVPLSLRQLLQVHEDELARVPQLVDEGVRGCDAVHGQVEVLARCRACAQQARVSNHGWSGGGPQQPGQREQSLLVS